MEKITKAFYITLIILLLILSLLTIVGLDWQISWFVPLALIFFVSLLSLAIINFKKLILLLIIVLPTIISFNNIKINITKYFSSLNNYNIPLNLLALTSIFIILLGIITIFSQWQKIKKIPLKFILLAYSFYITTSIFWSINNSDSLTGLVYFLTPFFMYVITYSYFSKKEDLINLILTSILSSVGPVAIAFYQLITGQYFFEPDSTLARITGPFVHPNLFGLYLFVILALIASYYFSKKDQKIKNNKLILSYSAILFFVFILTYSRVSWACFGLFFLLLTIIKHNLLLLLATAVPVFSYFALSIKTIKFRITEMFSNTLFSSWIARKNIWEVSWNEIIKKPIFGHGIGTAEAVIEKAKPWKGGTSIPHNDFFLYSIELGFVGFVLFASYTLGAIYHTYKSFLSIADKDIEINTLGLKTKINLKKISFILLAMLLSILLASAFESISRRMVTQIIIWSILGSLFSISQKKEK